MESETLRYLMLDEEDFRCLVRGGVVEWDNIKIALRDIGFSTMYKSLEDALDGVDIGKNHKRRG